MVIRNFPKKVIVSLYYMSSIMDFHFNTLGSLREYLWEELLTLNPNFLYFLISVCIYLKHRMFAHVSLFTFTARKLRFKLVGNLEQIFRPV